MGNKYLETKRQMQQYFFEQGDADCHVAALLAMTEEGWRNGADD